MECLSGERNERHDAVAWWPIDGDTSLQQTFAQGIDIVDLVSEVTEMARFAVVLAVPSCM